MRRMQRMGRGQSSGSDDGLAALEWAGLGCLRPSRPQLIACLSSSGLDAQTQLISYTRRIKLAHNPSVAHPLTQRTSPHSSPIVHADSACCRAINRPVRSSRRTNRTDTNQTYTHSHTSMQQTIQSLHRAQRPRAPPPTKSGSRRSPRWCSRNSSRSRLAP